MTVPAHTLYDIVRKLAEGSQVVIEAIAEKGQVALRAGRSSFALASLPPGDFPHMTGGELPHRFELAAAELKGLIDKTRFAISTEETRYYLNGIYLHAGQSSGIGVLRAVATDGHRLARATSASTPSTIAMSMSVAVSSRRDFCASSSTFDRMGMVLRRSTTLCTWASALRSVLRSMVSFMARVRPCSLAFRLWLRGARCRRHPPARLDHPDGPPCGVAAERRSAHRRQGLEIIPEVLEV